MGTAGLLKKPLVSSNHGVAKAKRSFPVSHVGKTPKMNPPPLSP